MSVFLSAFGNTVIPNLQTQFAVLKQSQVFYREFRLTPVDDECHILEWMSQVGEIQETGSPEAWLNEHQVLFLC